METSNTKHNQSFWLELTPYEAPTLLLDMIQLNISGTVVAMGQQQYNIDKVCAVFQALQHGRLNLNNPQGDAEFNLFQIDGTTNILSNNFHRYQDVTFTQCQDSPFYFSC
ncbi:hypothetical protein DSO57_1026199 [Entomophthora muscae]|uniref:Uncharacterized protein n=1 Tax=Entomophthora muscae TaxID=34485 RepID=A0ACC2SEZ9_9FUNG|nr:hypothetical protein DSO57_1026199 [Entomophthora muscae]